jgi:uncharacterized protein YutE (UPF0331/DUF86 family)
VVDRPRLEQLLALLARYVRILRELADTPITEFTADPRNYGSAERFLQLAIETTLSIGYHVIADDGFDQPRSYAEERVSVTPNVLWLRENGVCRCCR